MLDTLTHSTAQIFIFIMSSWTVLLFALCSIHAPALCCDWLRQYGHHSNISLTLLHLMGGALTEEESPVSFPYKVYSRMRRAEVDIQLVFIKDSLKLIFELYQHGNLSSITWDTSKTHHFLLSIHRQTEELSNCVSSTKRANRRLRNYYRRLVKKTLYHTGFSTASWELIRKETERHLHQLDLLVNSIRASAAASRRRSAPPPQQH